VKKTIERDSCKGCKIEESQKSKLSLWQLNFKNSGIKTQQYHKVKTASRRLIFSNMKIQLFDLNGNPITDWLIEIFDKRLLCTCDSIDYLPMGSIIDEKTFDPEQDIENQKYYTVNKNDMINVRYSGWSGCCGPDGYKLNVRSWDNLRIGYEYGDCYMSHYISIPKTNVHAKMEHIADKTWSIFALTEYKKELKIIDRVVGFDYDKVMLRLKDKINFRLKWEIKNAKTIKILKERITYVELNEMTFELSELDGIDGYWLFTKYHI